MSPAAVSRVDALIVGAGPAGCVAAIRLARVGWSVALVERQPFPRRKVCGECVAASNLALLHALDIGPAFDAAAGPALRRVTVMAGHDAVTAELPAAEPARHRWGRALGREVLDTLLLQQAQASGARVLQPCTLASLDGAPGRWTARLRGPASAGDTTLRASLVIDAHGSWERLPHERRAVSSAGPVHRASDLLAFKANFSGSSLPAGEIAVLALDGGYGGMVVADGGMLTLAGCIRRDRLAALRLERPGLGAGAAVEAWLRQGCVGVRRALEGATRDGPWLASGPLAIGVRVDGGDGRFRIGNAAGEAHPILGEGLSMALQSADLLAGLLQAGGPSVPDAAAQAALQRRYAAAWRRAFASRLRLASLFAHLAMRPAGTTVLMAMARRWPALLTEGARWGGKVRSPAPRAAASPR